MHPTHALARLAPTAVVEMSVRQWIALRTPAALIVPHPKQGAISHWRLHQELVHHPAEPPDVVDVWYSAARVRRDGVVDGVEMARDVTALLEWTHLTLAMIGTVEPDVTPHP